MKNKALSGASSAILTRAKEWGASLAGFAKVADLKTAPSFSFAPNMPNAGEYLVTWGNDLGLKPGETAWPDKAKTLLVIGLAHPQTKPEMDWWVGLKNPPGNRRLINIVNGLGPWMEQAYGIRTFHLPYRVEKGGTYLKDAAVLAGLPGLYARSRWTGMKDL